MLRAGRASTKHVHESDGDGDNGGAAPPAPFPSMTYEELRESNIKRNEEFLQSIGLSGSADSMRSAVAQDKSQKRGRGASAGAGGRRKALATEQVNVRRSGRVTIDRVRVELETLDPENPRRAQLQSELDSMLEQKRETTFVPSMVEEADKYVRLSDPELSARVPINWAPESESDEPSAAGTTWSQQITIKTTSKKKMKAFPDFSKLSVAENDVAKLTEARVTSVFVHSSESALVVGAGDKLGNLGLWLVDQAGDSGIYKFKPHVSNLCKIWSPPSCSSRIYTGSYDGTVRFIDLDSASPSFTLAHCSPESLDDCFYTDISESAKSPSLIWATRSDGMLCSIDLRQPTGKYGWLAETRVEKGGGGIKCNSVHEHPSESHVVLTAGAGGVVALYDVRKAAGSLLPLRIIDGHSKSVNAAYFSPDGTVIVSVGQDDTVRCTSGFLSGACKSSTTKHDNHTGRWLSTFRPAFIPSLPSTFVLGSMSRPRLINIWNATKAESAGLPRLGIVKSISGELVGSVCSRNAFHPTLSILAGANSSGRVHIAR